MKSNTAYVIKVTVLLSLLWMVFLSASAMYAREVFNLDGTEVHAEEEHILIFQEYIEETTAELRAIYDRLKQKFEQGDYSEAEKDMADMRTIVEEEELPWNNHEYPTRESLPCPKYFTQCGKAYYDYRHLLDDCRLLIGEHDEKYQHYIHLHQSQKDTSRTHVPDYGDLDSIVCSRVHEPITSTQQGPSVHANDHAETSHGYRYADGSPFGSIPGFDLDDLFDTTTMTHYAGPSEYDTLQNLQHGVYPAYMDDDSSIYECTHIAHPHTTNDHAGLVSSHAGFGTPYIVTTSDHADPFFSHAERATPNPSSTEYIAGYGTSNPGGRLMQGSAGFCS
ncbi:hypothetical protein SeLEV6574_g05606 [Synchytrium endobioticum]|uniref:Uncharacterized protein n=1 Tax=Synchytrium endobioticum TaxID=286115 RepID=A0A507CTM2_9FUNG|nr:hypothetical protein SeLEV6574_g05606 [Synchytrium endobioticum]